MKRGTAGHRYADGHDLKQRKRFLIQYSGEEFTCKWDGFLGPRADCGLCPFPPVTGGKTVLARVNVLISGPSYPAGETCFSINYGIVRNSTALVGHLKKGLWEMWKEVYNPTFAGNRWLQR